MTSKMEGGNRGKRVCPREVDGESRAGQWAGMSGRTVGYLTRTLTAMPNYPGLLVVLQ